MIDQLIVDVSNGVHETPPEMVFSQFVSMLREANAIRPHVNFVLLHLHKTPVHRLRLFSAWAAMTGVTSDAIEGYMNEILLCLMVKCFIY